MESPASVTSLRFLHITTNHEYNKDTTWAPLTLKDTDDREDRELDEESPLAANYRAMLEVKEKEIEQLRSQAEASDRQLKIQTKVNNFLLDF